MFQKWALLLLIFIIHFCPANSWVNVSNNARFFMSSDFTCTNCEDKTDFYRNDFSNGDTRIVIAGLHRQTNSTEYSRWEIFAIVGNMIRVGDIEGDSLTVTRKDEFLGLTITNVMNTPIDYGNIRFFMIGPYNYEVLFTSIHANYTILKKAELKFMDHENDAIIVVTDTTVFNKRVDLRFATYSPQGYYDSVDCQFLNTKQGEFKECVDEIACRTKVEEPFIGSTKWSYCFYDVGTKQYFSYADTSVIRFETGYFDIFYRNPIYNTIYCNNFYDGGSEFFDKLHGDRRLYSSVFIRDSNQRLEDKVFVECLFGLEDYRQIQVWDITWNQSSNECQAYQHPCDTKGRQSLRPITRTTIRTSLSTTISSTSAVKKSMNASTLSPLGKKLKNASTVSESSAKKENHDFNATSEIFIPSKMKKKCQFILHMIIVVAVDFLLLFSFLGLCIIVELSRRQQIKSRR